MPGSAVKILSTFAVIGSGCVWVGEQEWTQWGRRHIDADTAQVDTDSDTDDDVDCSSADVGILNASYSCDQDVGWSASISAEGLADESLLILYQEGDKYVWEERHPLELSEDDTSTCRQTWSNDLSAVYEIKNQVKGETTLFWDCEGMRPTMEVYFELSVGASMVDCWLYDFGGTGHFSDYGCYQP